MRFPSGLPQKHNKHNLLQIVDWLQVMNAQQYGAEAILLFNDPEDFAPVPEDQLYPHGWWLPRTGVQRGAVFKGNGDPLTPRYPSRGT